MKIKQKTHFSIRNKILVLLFAVAIPCMGLAVYLLISMHNYSEVYGKVVSEMTVANNYNITFKEKMDESMYKMVVCSVNSNAVEEDTAWEDPFVLIADLRRDFTGLKKVTQSKESRIWLDRLLRNTDTLEKQIKDIQEKSQTVGNYQENLEALDSNIYIMTDLIQEDIQYYIYYQTKSMDYTNQRLNEEINHFLIVAMILFGILFFGVLSVAFLITTDILRPVKELNAATEAVAKGNFEVRASVNSRDEFAALAHSFNDMAANMEQLLERAKEDERKMRRMDLRLLQEQINPHFLYNTLDTIVWLIEADETEKATEMVVTLSSFFRIVLSKGKEMISIREEEEHIASYLQIQEVRYHDILEYDIQMDKVLYDYKIPKLTLQPIVENALYHGIKYKRARGYIHIHGEKKGDLIYFTVRDNGAGMEKDELDKLLEVIQRPCNETQSGFGLANVNERIRMYYGAEYGMKIRSTPGEGTTVEIVIPAVR